MLNLRPGNVPALTRAAKLRELFGDAEGSSELLDMVLDSTSAVDTPERAWVFTQLGHLRLTVGDTDGAEQFLQKALKVDQNYDDALEYLAAVRIAQKRYDEASTLLLQSYAAAPRTERLFLLGQTLAMGKRDIEAAKTFAEFEKAAAAKVHQPINANVELAMYYADREHLPGKALEVASYDYSWRHDMSKRASRLRSRSRSACRIRVCSIMRGRSRCGWAIGFQPSGI
jgi:tetratricopeptide (TPR) repeat protein